MPEITKKEIDSRISSTKEYIIKSKESLKNKDYNNALKLFNNADDIVQKLIRIPSCSNILSELKLPELREKIFYETRKKGIFIVNSKLNDGMQIINYFKTNSYFVNYLKKNKEALFFIYEMMEKPNWLCGMSWEVIINIIQNKKEFKLIKTSNNSIKSFIPTISNFKSSIVMIEGGKNLTLDEGLKIIDEYFSNLDNIYQLFYDRNKIIKNNKINFLLLK